METGETIKDLGRTQPRQGATRQPAPQRPPTPAMMIAERKLNALKALDKILTDNKTYEYKPGSKDANLPIPIYLRDKMLPQHYMDDPAVAPYLPEVRKMLDEMARSENIKQVKDIRSLIGETKTAAQAEHKQAKTENDIQGITETLQGIDQDLGLMGGAEKQDSVSYDEVAR